jgi:hypothetical protein
MILLNGKTVLTTIYFSGALLVAKFQYPDLHTVPVIQEIEKIKRNVWLELNSFLTPLEASQCNK